MRKIKSIVLTALLLSTLFIVITPPATADPVWFNAGWTYRKEITINSSQVPSNLTNFPICINITDTDLRDNAQPDGDDITFTNETGTQLNHEIELYNSTTGKLVCWVNVTDLSGSSDTTLYMYYGNDGASNQEYLADVWDSGYDAVWHFNDFNDSTANGKDLISAGHDPEMVEGKLGYDFVFDSDNSEYIRFTEVNYEGYNEWNILTYFNISKNTGSLQTILWMCDYTIWHFQRTIPGNNQYEGTIFDKGGTVIDPDEGFDIDNNHWYFEVNNRDNPLSTSIVYNNSVGHYATVSQSGVPRNRVDEFWIGARQNGPDRYLDGHLTEMRLSGISRSNAYTNTSFNTIHNATDGGFFTLGSEEPSIPIISNEQPADGITGVSTTNTELNVTINDTAGGLFNYTFYLDGVEVDNGTNVAAGSYSTPIDLLCGRITYTWWINVSNDAGWSNNSFSFSTESCPVSYIAPSPSEGYACPCVEGYVCLCLTPIAEFNVNISFYNETGVKTLIEKASNVSAETCVLLPVTRGQTYNWSANISEYGVESNYNNTPTYSFTVASEAYCAASDGSSGGGFVYLVIPIFFMIFGLIFMKTRKKEWR